MYSCHGTYVAVRGQLTGVSSLLALLGHMGWPQVTRFCGKHFYPLKFSASFCLVAQQASGDCCHRVVGLQECVPTVDFYGVSGEPNPGHLVGATSSLLTEPSPQPPRPHTHPILIGPGNLCVSRVVHIAGTFCCIVTDSSTNHTTLGDSFNVLKHLMSL